MKRLVRAFIVGVVLLPLGAAQAEAGEEKAPGKAKVQKAEVTVTGEGFTPASLTLEAGVPAEITFLRNTDETCGTEVVFPDLQIKQEIPLNKPVVVSLTPEKTKTLTFTCGMDMMKGTIIAQ